MRSHVINPAGHPERLVPARRVRDASVHAGPGRIRLASESETDGGGRPAGRPSRLPGDVVPAVRKTLAACERVRPA